MAWCVVGRGVSILYLLFQRTQTQSSPEVPTPGKCRRRKCGNAAPSVSVLARVLGGPAESTEFVYRRGYQKSGDKSRISKRHAEATRCVNLRKRGPPPPSSSSSSSSSYVRRCVLVDCRRRRRRRRRVVLPLLFLSFSLASTHSPFSSHSLFLFLSSSSLHPFPPASHIPPSICHLTPRA